jgi:hypothetical protein
MFSFKLGTGTCDIFIHISIKASTRKKILGDGNSLTSSLGLSDFSSPQLGSSVSGCRGPSRQVFPTSPHLSLALNISECRGPSRQVIPTSPHLSLALASLNEEDLAGRSFQLLLTSAWLWRL